MITRNVGSQGKERARRAAWEEWTTRNYGNKGELELVGMKGERGIVGDQGRKGDKGGKGESAKQDKQVQYHKPTGNNVCGAKKVHSSGTPTLLHQRSFEGYCENVPQGAVRVDLWVGKCSGQSLGNANTGWGSVSRIIIEEVSRPQS